MNKKKLNVQKFHVWRVCFKCANISRVDCGEYCLCHFSILMFISLNCMIV